MKTRIVRIGNSRGIRLPKLMIEHAGLSEDVELHVRSGTIVIAAATGARAGWAEAAAQMRSRGENGLLDKGGPTKFDQDEW